MGSLLAMHMANELLDVPIAIATLVIAIVVVAIASRRIGGNSIAENNLSLMGVMGAFVFAAEMINFTLPGMPGTSGHIGGGILLSILLGPAAGIVTMSAILIVQCLLFQDGGLLALGCNIINLGIVPCLLGSLTYRVVLGSSTKAAAWRQYLAAWIACVIGVTAGAALVPFEAALSGVLLVPLSQFLAVMIGVHLVIAFCEGAVTFAVIAYLRFVKPELLGIETAVAQKELFRPGYGIVCTSLLVTAFLLAGVVSWFASSWPDGLEWSYKHHSYAETQHNIRNQSHLHAAVDQWQNKWSLMTDYSKRKTPLGTISMSDYTTESKNPADTASSWAIPDGWRSLAGVLGTVVTLILLYLVSKTIRKTSIE